jgi:DsbC/DsbD-like thiol-disulfide interchange protein
MIKLALMLLAAAWTNPVEVHHDDQVAVSYQARVDGPYLVIRATLQPGWHTFAMDNKVRADEKLAGKKSLGIDHPTEIAVKGGLATEGGWLQTPPKDFSKPELRWFSWGFERQALFAAKVKRTAGAPAKITLRGQACTETTCKNIDVELTVPAGKIDAAPVELDLKTLVPVRL